MFLWWNKEEHKVPRVRFVTKDGTWGVGELPFPSSDCCYFYSAGYLGLPNCCSFFIPQHKQQGSNAVSSSTESLIKTFPSKSQSWPLSPWLNVSKTFIGCDYFSLVWYLHSQSNLVPEKGKTVSSSVKAQEHCNKHQNL